jgi:tetratricopeptide (TPR) repeat protein
MARFKPSLLALTISLALGAQSGERRWADAAEYDLATQAFGERDPQQQIALLQDWESRYPKTEFERERLVSFALAFERLGKVDEAFTRATELLKLNPNYPQALLLVATIGPALPFPTDSQVAMVSASAIRLQSVKLTPSPLVSTALSSGPTSGSTSVADPENEEVLNFLRERRRNRAARTDPEVVKRRVVEAALRWTKNR